MIVHIGHQDPVSGQGTAHRADHILVHFTVSVIVVKVGTFIEATIYKTSVPDSMPYGI